MTERQKFSLKYNSMNSNRFSLRTALLRAAAGTVCLLGSAAFGQDAHVYGIFAPGGVSSSGANFSYRDGAGPFRQFRTSGSTTATYQYGVGGEVPLGRGFGAGAEVTGLNVRSFDLGSTIVVFSPNVYYHFRRGQSRLDPFVTGGYTLFARPGTTNLANFGGGVNYYLNERWGLRLEVRDHVPFESGRTHFWGVRFGVVLR